MASPAKIGIVTVSDRASAGVYADEGGPAILDYLSKALASPWQAVTRVIPDERGVIAQTLIELADKEGLLPDRHHWRHRPGPARRHARGDRGRD
jgi:molybdopterin adenylyltransferase